MTAILGVNAYHADSAAALLVDGELVAAAEEERFNRLKHWAGFPREAIRYVLREGGLSLAQVDRVALNRDPRASLLRKLRYTVARRPSPRLVLERVGNMRSWLALDEELRRLFPDSELRAPVTHVEHHLAHLASAFLVSPYEEAVCVAVDGFGDFASTSWGFGRGGRVAIDGRVHFPHSLGVFYEALTQFLGFPNYGDEYKVMGLAPYGEPRYRDRLEKVLRLREDGTFELDLRCFRHATGSVGYRWRDQTPRSGALFAPELAELLGLEPRGPDDELRQEHRDLARSVQAAYEDAFFNLLRALRGRYDCDALALAGGCAANSVANGKIALRSGYARSYVPAATGDAGGAIGAALVVWSGLPGASGRRPGDGAFTGPAYGREQVEELLAARRGALDAAGCSVDRVGDEEALCRRVAAAVADGLVAGWYQGRMEWGPRALGNRSILGDPRRADMKDVLNRKIKRRESFRPFAPSVLREAVPEWFEQDGEVPFMSKVFVIREERRAQIPAVTHVDGTGRLQTVRPEENPRYHRLISAFRDLTGVPMVLNTSFNENEPIVCRPEEALDCFLRTSMDLLVLGDALVARRR